MITKMLLYTICYNNSYIFLDFNSFCLFFQTFIIENFIFLTVFLARKSIPNILQCLRILFSDHLEGTGCIWSQTTHFSMTPSLYFTLYVPLLWTFNTVAWCHSCAFQSAMMTSPHSYSLSTSALTVVTSSCVTVLGLVTSTASKILRHAFSALRVSIRICR